MTAPRRPLAECDQASLARAVAQARRACNLALQVQAEARHAAACRAAPPVRYLGLGAGGADDGRMCAIDGALFLRRHALVLDTLELTWHGYCVQRRGVWDRRVESVFSTQVPPLWRRLLRRAPLLALTVQARAGATSVRLGPARRSAASAMPLVVRLDSAAQAELARLDLSAAPVRTPAARLLAWLLG